MHRRTLPLREAFLVAVLSALAAAPPIQGQVVPLTELGPYVEASMEDWGVPGLALAIVKDDAVVYARGFGVRDVSTGEPVDENTLFAVGSTSKAFTATSLGMLVDEGRVSWDDRVIDHLPGFQMNDPHVTNELTVRDLLTHRSGLARGDAVWYDWPHGREEIIRRVRYLKPTRSFRGAWQYQNLMFLTAGEVVHRVSGASWDDFVASRIFRPLGMDRSVTSVNELSRFENVATPHVHVDGKPVTIPHKNIDNVGPAGSIYSSVSQMAQWVRLHLAEGAYDGTTLVSDSVMEEMHASQMVIQADAPENSLHAREAAMSFNTYGLAWWVLDYRGHKVVDHGGGIDGMRAHVAFMPDLELGMVALSNARPNNLIVALMYRVFDHWLGGERVDWSESMLAEQQEATERQRAVRADLDAQRIPGTSPSLSLPEYEGTYEDVYFGAVDVTLSDGTLQWSFGGKTKGRLEHWHHDVFRMVPDTPAGGERFARFALDPRGTVDQMEIRGLGTFTRR